MSAPTPNTRRVAHAAVGIAGGAAAKKLLGTGGFLVLLAGFAFVVVLHEAFNAPLAKAIANVGLQF